MGGIMTLYLGEMLPDTVRGIIPINGGVYISSPSWPTWLFAAICRMSSRAGTIRSCSKTAP